MLGASIGIVLISWCGPNRIVTALCDHIVRNNELPLITSDILIACTIESLDARDTCYRENVRWVDDFNVAKQVDDTVAVTIDDPVAVRCTHVELLLQIQLIDNVAEFIPKPSWRIRGRVNNRDVTKAYRTGSGKLQGDPIRAIGYIDGAAIRNRKPGQELNSGAVRSSIVSCQTRNVITNANLHLIYTSLGRESFSIGYDYLVSTSAKFFGSKEANKRITGSDRTPSQI